MGEEAGPAEIPGLQCQCDATFLADQDRHAGIYLGTDAQIAKVERLGHGTRGFATGDDKAPDSAVNELPGRVGKQLVQPARDGFPAISRLGSGDLMGIARGKGQGLLADILAKETDQIMARRDAIHHIVDRNGESRMVAPRRCCTNQLMTAVPLSPDTLIPMPR